jgi:hypothetical protein
MSSTEEAPGTRRLWAVTPGTLRGRTYYLNVPGTNAAGTLPVRTRCSRANGSGVDPFGPYGRLPGQ